jgi:transcriptional regulator with XRE-family HTH domain
MDGLRKMRKKRHMTQEKLGELVGVKRTTVTLWENGINKPNSDKLVKLSQVLQCSVDALLYAKT